MLRTLLMGLAIGLIAFSTLPPASAQIPVSADASFDFDPMLERCREAAVRIRSGNSVGSGCMFAKKDGKILVLTNAHVAGRKGSTVTVQMWWRGYLSKQVRGRVIWSVMARNYYRDIAIVEINESDLGGYKPPIIPLAPRDYQGKFQRLYSFGCGAGSWLTNWEGHAMDLNSRAGDVIKFFPQPAGGRSGSSIFSHDGKYIVALIAWRSPVGQHSLDGGSESPNRHGIAMTFRELYAAFDAKPQTGNQVSVTPLELPKYTTELNPKVPADAPKIFRDNALATSKSLQDPNNPEDHEVLKIQGNNQLRFTDPTLRHLVEPKAGGKIERSGNSEYTKQIDTPSQRFFPGMPRRERQQSPPDPELQLEPDEKLERFEMYPNLPDQRERPDPPEPELEKPEPKPEPEPDRRRRRPFQPEPEPELEKAPELPETPEQEPEQQPEMQEDEDKSFFGKMTDLFGSPALAFGVIGLSLISIFNFLINPFLNFTAYLAYYTRRDKLSKMVCRSDDVPEPIQPPEPKKPVRKKAVRKKSSTSQGK